MVFVVVTLNIADVFLLLFAKHESPALCTAKIINERIFLSL